MTILALNILRDAGKPLATEEINLRLMAARGLSTADKPLARMDAATGPFVPQGAPEARASAVG